MIFGQGKKKICYLSGTKKYRYFEGGKKPIINVFYRQHDEKKLQRKRSKDQKERIYNLINK